MPHQFRGSIDGTLDTDLVRFDGSLDLRILSLFVAGRPVALSPSRGDQVHLFRDRERGSALAWAIRDEIHSAISFGAPDEIRQEALDGLRVALEGAMADPQGWFGLRQQ